MSGSISKVSLLRLGSGFVRVVGIAVVSVVLLVGGAAAANADSVGTAGTTSSHSASHRGDAYSGVQVGGTLAQAQAAPLTAKVLGTITTPGYFNYFSLTPDRLYADEYTGTDDSTYSVVQASISPTAVGTPQTLVPAMAASALQPNPLDFRDLNASTGRVAVNYVAGTNGKPPALFDRGASASNTSLTSMICDLSGTWSQSNGNSDGYCQTVSSLDGTTLDISQYYSSSATANSYAGNQFGSLFDVVTQKLHSGTCDTGSGSCPIVDSTQVSVRDAANAGAPVGSTVTLPVPSGAVAGDINPQSCYLSAGEIDCFWSHDVSSTTWPMGTVDVGAAWVTRTDFLTGKTTTVALPLPAPSANSSMYQSVNARYLDGPSDGVAIIEVDTPWMGGFAGGGSWAWYAYNLNNPSQYVEILDSPMDGNPAFLGDLVAYEEYQPGMDPAGTGQYSQAQDNLTVWRLPFGGEAAPTLIGVVGGSAPVTTAAPLKLDLDFSKPVGAGTLTVTDSAGKAVGQVTKTSASPDGSLRGVTWAPPTGTPSGTYTWTFDATDSGGRPVVANVGSGAVSGSFTVMATCSTFTDVAPSYQFAPYICWMSANGITHGMTPTTYVPKGPDGSVTREAMAAFMFRLAGVSYSASKPSFTDVLQDNSQFFTEIEWMNYKGITHGMGDGTYAPKQPVTREAMAAFLYRMAGSPSFVLPSTPTFSDVSNDKTSTNYNQFYTEIEWMNAMGITTGMTPTTYAPKAPVTREAMAAFMWRMSNQKLYCTTYSNGVGC